MGLEVRATKGSILGDFKLSKNSTEVYNCSHTGTKDKPPYPCPDKGCLMVPTFPQCGSQVDERFEWVLVQCRHNYTKPPLMPNPHD